MCGEVMQYLLAADAFRGLEAWVGLTYSQRIWSHHWLQDGREATHGPLPWLSKGCVLPSVPTLYQGPIKIIGYELLDSPGATGKAKRQPKAGLSLSSLTVFAKALRGGFRSCVGNACLNMQHMGGRCLSAKDFKDSALQIAKHCQA